MAQGSANTVAGRIVMNVHKKEMAKTTKNQRRVFYTILSIAKSTLFFSTITVWVR